MESILVGSRHNYMSKYIPVLLFLVSDTEVGLAFAALCTHQGSAGSSPDQRQPPHASCHLQMCLFWYHGESKLLIIERADISSGKEKKRKAT